ncbi:hypothetical protein DA717_14340, partial [Piscirickettsiaceae bacterium NZ-RLO2]
RRLRLNFLQQCQLEDLIAEYIHHYNHERPHQALGDFVSAEVFSGAKIIS